MRCVQDASLCVPQQCVGDVRLLVLLRWREPRERVRDERLHGEPRDEEQEEILRRVARRPELVAAAEGGEAIAISDELVAIPPEATDGLSEELRRIAQNCAESRTSSRSTR